MPTGHRSSEFQSTLPREERRMRWTNTQDHPNFNPRSHERSDGILMKLADIEDNFNPRSHERSDGENPRTNQHKKISIHAPTRGATAYPSRPFLPRLYFNPRSHERSDSQDNHTRQGSQRFQSTLPREERQQYCTKNLFIFIQYRQ